MDNETKDICYLSAEEAIKRFKDRSLSPVELMKAVIARCEEVNPKLNAITNSFYDQALKQAKEAETRYMSGAETRPLEGVPMAVKELHPIKGVETTWGSKIFEGVPADYTIPALQRLFDAGAIMHIRTTTPEFAHAGHCNSPLYGITRNPWNQQYSSCGSSGGSGVAMATGMAIISEGDDGGGSIRMPASANGVFGFKPPFGRNPGCLLETIFETILHVGPITRTVGDAALMQNVMSGQHPMDPTSLPCDVEIPTESGDIKNLRIAFSPDLGYFEIDKEVARNTLQAVERLRDLGAVVEEVDLGWTEEVYDSWVTHWEGLFATVAQKHMTQWQYKMDPFVRGLITRGMNHRHVRVKATELARSKQWARLASIFENYDVLVCPTLAVPAILADHKNDDPDFKINGKPVDAYLNWALTYPFNLLSSCPVASVPSGFSSSGVPTGMQIVGKPYDDLSVFRVAREYEKAAPWDNKRPEV